MRITGGLLRSRRLVAPAGTATRPTSDRVREALFSILGARVTLRGSRVLDLYAGSGALAFEALSRGASHATLVERAREALTAIRENAASLDVRGSVSVIASSVDRALRGLASTASFDVVFIDPPYADVASGEVAKTLDVSGLAAHLAEDGILVLEHASSNEAPTLAGLEMIDARTYGDTALALFARAHASSDATSDAT